MKHSPVSPSRKDGAEVFLFDSLHWRSFRDIIDRKTKMRRLTGVGAPASLHRCEPHLYNGLEPLPHGILYDIPSFFARVPFPYLFLPFFVRWNMLLTLCRLALRSVFVFRSTPGGGKRSLGVYKIIFTKRRGEL